MRTWGDQQYFVYGDMVSGMQIRSTIHHVYGDYWTIKNWDRHVDHLSDANQVFHHINDNSVILIKIE